MIETMPLILEQLPQDAPNFKDPVAAARAWLAQQEAIKNLEEALQIKNDREEKLLAYAIDAVPSADFYDYILNHCKLKLCPEGLAELYGIESTILEEYLLQADFLIRKGNVIVPSVKAISRGYVVLDTAMYYTPTHRSVGISYEWTKKGVLIIYQELKSRFGILPLCETEGEWLGGPEYDRE